MHTQNRPSIVPAECPDSQPPLTAADNTAPAPGVYQHYKGALYEVLGVAQHSESGEHVVVYRALYGQWGLWVRPLNMFQETVEHQGQKLPRFAPTNLPAPQPPNKPRDGHESL